MLQPPRLVRRDDIRPRVDHRTVQVGTMWFDEPPADDERIQVPGAGLYLSTVWTDHHPLVRLESWSGEPPEPEEGIWTYRREFRAALEERLAVLDLFGFFNESAPVTPGPYRFRLLHRSRELDPDEDDKFPEPAPREVPLEVWLFQLWPEH
ncbi:hypothetical protein ACIOG4_07960 [Streptomyces microflavus]|uniref:hypothetical protein n=1 Tax=Streptomyces microflavus TaxID=1919 RepID=UPI0038300A14